MKRKAFGMRKKQILVIDGQGGKIGKQIIETLKETFENIFITAIGTNGNATASMLKAGADQGATGENPVIVACKKADIIIGPIGIVVADSLLGEISEKMAIAVGKGDAIKILIPINRCNNIIVGVTIDSIGKLIDETMEQLKVYLD